LSLSQRAVGEKNSRSEPYVAESSEYFCGHNVDPLAYRRIHELDPEYRRRQYKIVEPFLSPLSHPRHATQSLIEAQQKKMEEMAYRIQEMEMKLEAMMPPVDSEVTQEVAGIKMSAEPDEEEEELPKLDGAPTEEATRFSAETNRKNYGKKVVNSQSSFLAKLYN
jgi:hypothetical protein